MTAVRLILPPEIRRQMILAAERAFPNEACGLMLGRKEDGCWMVDNFRPAANFHPTPQMGFELDPSAHFAALRQARAAQNEGRNLHLLGHMHSHPNGLARPSATDRAMAHDPEMIWLILAVQEGEALDLTAWMIEAEGNVHSVMVAEAP